MGLYDISVLAAFSIAPALLLSFFKLGYWIGNFRPFFTLIWIGFANDLLSWWLARLNYSTALLGNIYVLT